MSDIKAFTPEKPDYDKVAGTYVSRMRRAIDALAREVVAVDQLESCLELSWSTIGLQTCGYVVKDLPKRNRTMIRIANTAKRAFQK